MTPPAPAALKVFCQSETEDDTPGVSGSIQVAKLLGEVYAGPELTLNAMTFVWHGVGFSLPLVTIP
jgi:hypothetical protein